MGRWAVVRDRLCQNGQPQMAQLTEWPRACGAIDQLYEGCYQIGMISVLSVELVLSCSIINTSRQTGSMH